VKPKVQLEETRFKLRRVSKSFESFTLDRTCPVSANSHCVSTWLTGRGPCEDRTHWSCWHVSQRVSELIGRDWKTIGRVHSASGLVPVRYFADRTRPIITDRTRPSVRLKYSKVLARPDAFDQSWSVRPVTQRCWFQFRPLPSTGASGHVDRRVRLAHIFAKLAGNGWIWLWGV
jgi:hypothetical protein